MFMGFPDLRVDPDDLRPAPVGVDLPRAERVQGVAAGVDAGGDDPQLDHDTARAAVGRVPAPGLVQGPPTDARTCAPSAACSTARSWRASSRASGTTRRRSSRCRPRSSARCSPVSPTRCSPVYRRGRTGASSAPSTSSSRAASASVVRRLLQTGLIQAFAAHHLVQQPPRMVGFASPCEAFGHRATLGARGLRARPGRRLARRADPPRLPRRAAARRGFLEIGGGRSHLLDPPDGVEARSREQPLEERLADDGGEVSVNAVFDAGGTRRREALDRGGRHALHEDAAQQPQSAASPRCGSITSIGTPAGRRRPANRSPRRLADASAGALARSGPPPRAPRRRRIAHARAVASASIPA